MSKFNYQAIAEADENRFIPEPDKLEDPEYEYRNLIESLTTPQYAVSGFDKFEPGVLERERKQIIEYYTAKALLQNAYSYDDLADTIYTFTNNSRTLDDFKEDLTYIAIDSEATFHLNDGLNEFQDYQMVLPETMFRRLVRSMDAFEASCLFHRVNHPDSVVDLTQEESDKKAKAILDKWNKQYQGYLGDNKEESEFSRAHITDDLDF